MKLVGTEDKHKSRIDYYVLKFNSLSLNKDKAEVVDFLFALTMKEDRHYVVAWIEE